MNAILSKIFMFADTLQVSQDTAPLVGTKMAWANERAKEAGVELVWVVMPPISLRMYHLSAGWDINRM